MQKLLASKQSLESEVRKLKLQLNDERSARHNGLANHHDQEFENECEYLLSLYGVLLLCRIQVENRDKFIMCVR